MTSYAQVRAVILDVDGVLLDVTASYHAVAEEAARRAVAAVLGEKAAQAVPFDRLTEVPRFKAAGNFNDDWETARGIALLLYLRARGEAPPLDDFLAEARGRGVAGLFSARAGSAPRHEAFTQESIFRACGALYGGRKHCRELFGFAAEEALRDAPERGFWEREELLPDLRVLVRVAARFPLALYTGRNPGEAALALVRSGLQIPRARCWVADGRPRKPDPTGLLWLCSELLPRGGSALFVGDTADDLAAAKAAEAGGAPLIYAHVQGPGDTTRIFSRLLQETGDSP